MVPVLRCVNIHKRYGTLEILKGISLEVSQGEMVCLIGPSGAGKTTLLQIMGMLDKADAGEVWLDGKRIDHLKEKELAWIRNTQLGFVFQFHHLLPEFTALENVAIPAMIKGCSKKESFQRAEELLVSLGLAHRLHHKPGMLSGGEQQRTAVARALINDPKVILADEPSGNLDHGNAVQLHSLFKHLKEGMCRTFVIVTHSQELASIADTVYYLKEGSISRP